MSASETVKKALANVRVHLRRSSVEQPIVRAAQEYACALSRALGWERQAAPRTPGLQQEVDRTLQEHIEHVATKFGQDMAALVRQELEGVFRKEHQGKAGPSCLCSAQKLVAGTGKRVSLCPVGEAEKGRQRWKGEGLTMTTFPYSTPRRKIVISFSFEKKEEEGAHPNGTRVLGLIGESVAMRIHCNRRGLAIVNVDDLKQITEKGSLEVVLEEKSDQGGT